MNNVSNKVKFSFYLLVVTLLILQGMIKYGNCETSSVKNIYYDFSNNNGNFTLTAKIFINAKTSTIADLLYEYNNVKRFFQYAESTEIISQNQNQYDMRITYKYWIFRADVIYRRILSINNKRIYFKMLSYSVNSKLLPEIVSSNGYYEITQEGAGALLTLHNETILKSYLPMLSTMLMNKEDAFKYLEDVKSYAEKIEGRANDSREGNMETSSAKSSNR